MKNVIYKKHWELFCIFKTVFKLNEQNFKCLSEIWIAFLAFKIIDLFQLLSYINDIGIKKSKNECSVKFQKVFFSIFEFSFGSYTFMCNKLQKWLNTKYSFINLENENNYLQLCREFNFISFDTNISNEVQKLKKFYYFFQTVSSRFLCKIQIYMQKFNHLFQLYVFLLSFTTIGNILKISLHFCDSLSLRHRNLQSLGS